MRLETKDLGPNDEMGGDAADQDPAGTRAFCFTKGQTCASAKVIVLDP